MLWPLHGPSTQARPLSTLFIMEATSPAKFHGRGLMNKIFQRLYHSTMDNNTPRPCSRPLGVASTLDPILGEAGLCAQRNSDLLPVYSDIFYRNRPHAAPTTHPHLLVWPRVETTDGYINAICSGPLDLCAPPPALLLLSAGSLVWPLRHPTSDSHAAAELE